MTLLRQKGITLVNCCNAKYDVKTLTDAILWKADKPVQSIKHVYMHGKYACVSIGKGKFHIHRLIKEFILKQTIPVNFHVHHKDGDKLNNMEDNLEVIEQGVHLSNHNKGKPISEKTRIAIINFNHHRKGKRTKPHRPDVTPKKVYDMKHSGLSFNKISKLLKMDWGCVKQRYNDYIHDNPELLKGGAK